MLGFTHYSYGRAHARFSQAHKIIERFYKAILQSTESLFFILVAEVLACLCGTITLVSRQCNRFELKSASFWFPLPLNGKICYNLREAE